MDSASKILDIAERRMRQAGYNAVSYRDIADEMGIKSASLHYHFPKKEDLGAALVRRYSDTFQGALNAATEDISQPKARVEAFVTLCQRALTEQRLVCLCAVLGAEAPGLPLSVTSEVKSFFDAAIGWLAVEYKAMGLKPEKRHAQNTLSLIEGAMIVSSVLGDESAFASAAEMIIGALP